MDSTIVISDQLVARYLSAVDEKSKKITSKLDASSEKALNKIYAIENSIWGKLSKKGFAPKGMPTNLDSQYVAIRQQTVSKYPKFARYIPGLDSMQSAVKYLSAGKNKYGKVLDKLPVLETSISKAEMVKKFLHERQTLLAEQIKGLPVLSDLKKMQKSIYYYKQQADEYRELLNDYSKVEKKALGILRNSKVFKDFMKKHSYLSGVFSDGSANADPAMLQGIIGLQPRAQVNQVMQNRLPNSAGSPQQLMQSALQTSKALMSKIAEKIEQLGGNSSEVTIPSFKPNEQKGKKILEKIELMVNVQSTKHNSLFPVTTDFGFSAGFVPRKSFIIGIGTSFKMGWGNSFRNINISAEGLSLRAFMDYKIRSTFYLSGGYENNYYATIKSIDQLKNSTGWKKSALLGFSRKYQLKNKKGEMKVLYDFFAQNRFPATSPVIFRVGFGLK